jgi:nanoRNase/pAp phosphatase (c-di-AMP/oligoRNAs hydrolase)
MTFAAVAVCGASLGFYSPRLVLNVSNLTDPSNSATATMLAFCVSIGAGIFLSPVIITNITFALAGESTRFRYQFTAFICLALAAFTFIKVRRDAKRAENQPEAGMRN